MTDSHPSFPNPSLVEMLCEIHFVPHAERDWDSKRPLSLYERVSSEFPEMELVPETNVEIDLTSDPVRPLVRQVASRIRFSNQEKSRFLQVSSAGDAFVINVVDKYPGWSSIKNLITMHWNSVQGVLLPNGIRRVGLRYINRVEHTHDAQHVADWLKPTRNIPEAMLSSLPGSSARVDIRLDEQHRSKVSVWFMEPSNPQMFGATIVDIDRTWEEKVHDRQMNLENTLETLHNDVWNEFSAALSDNFVAFLNKKV